MKDVTKACKNAVFGGSMWNFSIMAAAKAAHTAPEGGMHDDRAQKETAD